MSHEVVAIDEVQLCADFERGHIFTDRVLNRRGLEQALREVPDLLEHYLSDAD